MTGRESPFSVLPTPYYADGSVTIYNGDCREIMPAIEGAAAVITDPPYGIDVAYDVHDDATADWYPLMDDVVPLMRTAAPFVVMPSCAINRMEWWYANHPPDWLVAWYKGSPGHAAKIGFNDWEPHLAWGKPHAPMHDHFQTPCGFDDRGHPCPKPIEWARWLIVRAAPPGGLVIDPFMGSGTVLRGCKDLGRRGIGIDVSERYCEIAARRCAQEVLPIAGMDQKPTHEQTVIESAA